MRNKMYVDGKGMAKLLLIGAWTIYNLESTSGSTGDGKYSAGTGKPGNITWEWRYFDRVINGPTGPYHVLAT